jgi:hypothetical protein
MSVVYLASAVPAGMALYVGRLPSPVALASLSLTSSLVFFVSTNFAVWAFGTTYSHDLTGLLTCYVAALPFFKNTLVGDLFWTCVLFGGHRLFLVLRTIAATRVPERVTAA